ncbi:ABC transporter ATP-binding protein [Candidatus Sumerlaeota bacterium]|nr:ABC transporter ATP-binding protein [Candidatus Sumerlaeota bacterium]
MAEIPAIEVQGVSFAYQGFPVLRDINLTLERGQFASVVGPNGSGKTTLFRLFLGLLTPDRGTIRILGQSPLESRTRIGYVPQHFAFDPKYPIRVSDVVRMGCLGQGHRWVWGGRAERRRVRGALEAVGMGGQRNAPFSTLSGGQRQRVLIARALVIDPEILLLDEPTANVDAMGEEEILGLIEGLRGEMTVMLITHSVSVVSRFIETIICVNCEAHVHPAMDHVDAELMRHICGHRPIACERE